MRGQKQCKNEECGIFVGPRTYVCPGCGYDFNFKRESTLDWKKLEKGDVFKSKSGSGPYWLTKKGERISMGYHGRFKVLNILTDGILACSLKGIETQHVYIYMGPDKKPTGDTCIEPGLGMWAIAHRIEMVKSKKKRVKQK